MEGSTTSTVWGYVFYKETTMIISNKCRAKVKHWTSKIAHITQSEKKRLERQAQAQWEKAQQRVRVSSNRLRKSGSQPKILLDAMKIKRDELKEHQPLAKELKDQNQHKLLSLKEQKNALKPHKSVVPATG
ncbi:hypothetical protein O9992_01210 [Vibrio lentus]|nr:hypothetical protein [Vibrio lentus]